MSFIPYTSSTGRPNQSNSKTFYTSTLTDQFSGDSYTSNPVQLAGQLVQETGSSQWKNKVRVATINFSRSSLFQSLLNANSVYGVYFSYIDGLGNPYWSVEPMLYPYSSHNLPAEVETGYPLWLNGIVGGTVKYYVVGRQNGSRNIAFIPTSSVTAPSDVPHYIKYWVYAWTVVFNPNVPQIYTTKYLQVNNWEWNTWLDQGGVAPVTTQWINYTMPDWLDWPFWWQYLYGLGCTDPTNLYNLTTGWGGPAAAGSQAAFFLAPNFRQYLNPSGVSSSNGGGSAPYPTTTLQIQLNQLDQSYIGGQVSQPLLAYFAIEPRAGTDTSFDWRPLTEHETYQTMTAGGAAEAWSYRFINADNQTFVTLTASFTITHTLKIDPEIR